MPVVVDKVSLVHSFIISHVNAHLSRCRNTSHRALIIGLNGIQGSGKTTLVSSLKRKLSQPSCRASPSPSQSTHPPLRVIDLSLDDFYLPHAALTAVARSHPHNPLLQHRGQPGTHDVPLCLSTLESLRTGREVRIPRYDKSAHSGRGDRVQAERWETVNTEGEHKIDIVLFEGWCVGFRPLGAARVRDVWARAAQDLEREHDMQEVRLTGRLGAQRLEDVQLIDEYLREYDGITDLLDGLIHIDAEDTQWVYEWRMEQERRLRADRGSGMSDEEVVRFVNGYYPSYELFTAGLRAGIFDSQIGKQLRVVTGRDREVVRHEVI